jgi:hypothetical protein
LAYLTLLKNYDGSNPGSLTSLDSIVATGLGIFSHGSTPVAITDAGNYSWVVANNTQSSTSKSALIPVTTSIDFNISVTGAMRFELSYT